MSCYMKLKGRDGTAFIVVLLLAFIGATAVASFVSISSNNAKLSRQVIEYQQASIIAESGLEYGMMQLKDVLLDYQFTPSIDVATLQATLDAIPPPAAVGNYEYITISQGSG